MKRSTKLWIVPVAAMVALWASVASAQDADTDPVAEPAVDETPAAAEETPAEEAAPVETAGADTTADTTADATADAEPASSGPAPVDAVSQYWGNKRDVAVVQKRLFAKDGRLEFTVFGGVIPNDPFLTYIPVGGRFNYYFIESLSVEVAGAYTGAGVRIESDLATFLKNNQNIKANTDLLDKQIWRANAAVVWSPFYGKMALANANLSHFDINLVAGLGVVQTESPTVDRSSTQTEIKPEGTLGAGLRFFMTESVTLRLDYRQGIFQKIGGGVSKPSELTLGLSFFLGG